MPHPTPPQGPPQKGPDLQATRGTPAGRGSLPTPDVYQPSAELTGAISQVRNTAHKVVKKLEDLHRQHRDTGEFEFEVSTIRPRQVVVAGQLSQLVDGEEVNVEKLTSFEMWRRGELDVEVIKFDELYERAHFIVKNRSLNSGGRTRPSRGARHTFAGRRDVMKCRLIALWCNEV
jgi:hypothetical protein